MADTMTKTTFGTLLRQLREAAGMKQEDLASRVGVTGATISNWENDKHPASYAAVKSLVEVFGDTRLFELAGFPADGYENVFDVLRQQAEELAELKRTVADLQRRQN